MDELDFLEHRVLTIAAGTCCHCPTCLLFFTACLDHCQQPVTYPARLDGADLEEVCS